MNNTNRSAKKKRRGTIDSFLISPKSGVSNNRYKRNSNIEEDDNNNNEHTGSSGFPSAFNDEGEVGEDSNSIQVLTRKVSVTTGDDGVSNQDRDSDDESVEEFGDLNDEELQQLSQELTQTPEQFIHWTKDYSHDMSQPPNDDDEEEEEDQFVDSDYQPLTKKPRVEEEMDLSYDPVKVINQEGDKWVVRKRGEAFKLKGDERKTKICVIEEIIPPANPEAQNKPKRVKCNEYQRIEETFLGSDPEILNILGKKYEYVRTQFNFEMNVRDLEQKCCQKPKETDLLYNTESTNGGLEVTFTFMWKGYIECSDSVEEDEEDEWDRCQQPRTVIDLFSGAGGMSVGFLRNDFDVKWAVENDSSAAATYIVNHERFNTKVYDENIRDVLKEIKHAKKHNITDSNYSGIKPDVVWASPPCQGYSRANRNGGKNDALNRSMTFEFTNFVHLCKPSVAGMENVTGILDKKHRFHVQKVMALFLSWGYQVRMMILDSSDYGEAQARKRVFLFGVKRNLALPRRPEITHADPDSESDGDESSSKQKQMSIKQFCTTSSTSVSTMYSPIIEQKKKLPRKRTVKDVIEDLENVNTKSGGFFRLPDGTKTYNHIHYTDLKTEMEVTSEDKPARTVRAGNHFRHYRLDRILTLRELARIQGFPDDFRFFGNRGAIQRQIGNAVPCNLAAAVAKSIKIYCFPWMESSQSSL